MKSEPALDQCAVVAVLEREYGLCVTDVRFIPTAWTAYAYHVRGTDGTRWFLKLQDDTHPAVFAASCREFYLPLTDQLHALGILPRIPHPRRSLAGAFEVTYGPYRFILYNFIDGVVVGQMGFTPAVALELARLLGILHRRSSEVKVTPRLTERYEIAFESVLLHSLRQAEGPFADLTAAQRALHGLLREQHGRLLAMLDRLRQLQVYARGLDKPQVICHTDLHGDNLMLDAEGYLYILDWENALIAPPEHDLFFFAGEEGFWDGFLPAYRREAGDCQLDSRVLAFYYYRRGLEDMADWIVRIESATGGAARDQEDLAETQGCLMGMEHIEQLVAGIASHLGETA